MNDKQEQMLDSLNALKIPLRNIETIVNDSKLNYIEYDVIKKELNIIHYFLVNIDKIAHDSYNCIDEKVIEND